MAAMSRKRLARYVAQEMRRGANSKKLMQEVAAYLIEHKRPHDAEFVISDIAAELARAGAKGAVTVTTARPLGVSERKAIQDFAAKKMSVTSVELTERVDENVIGGVIIETPDARYDRSLRRGLEQLTSV
jgi:F0F1-type ATP synthase delta subunit